MEINNKMYIDTQLSQPCKHIWMRLEGKPEMLTVVIFMCKDFECVFCILLTW